MTAVAHWEIEPIELPAGVRRGHLSLVPPLSDEATSRPQARPRLRITPRGRLAVVLIVFAALAYAVLTRVAPVPVSEPAVAPVGQSVVTVRSGDTLSEIAAARLPQMPVREGVEEIKRMNGLRGTTIYAGQHLAVPAEA